MSSTHEGISTAANQQMQNIVRKLSSHFEFDFNDAMNLLQKVPLKKEMQDTTKYDEKLIVKIQAWWRGLLVRKRNKQLHDGMNLKQLDNCIDIYNYTIESERKINQSLKIKKIRLSNFPSHISENVAKFAIYHKYGIMPNWDSDKGDLVFKTPSKTIRFEVKGSINLSNGPPTFGPTEEWDHIYFVDGINTLDKRYKVYEIKLSNKSSTWRNMKVNKKQTYYEQCLEKRRPRITFCEIKSQIGKHCKLIFDGHISELSK